MRFDPLDEDLLKLMGDETTKSGRIGTWIGVIGAMIGVSATAFTIYDQMTQPAPALTVFLENMQYSPRREIWRTFKDVDAALSAAKIDQMLPSSLYDVGS